MCNKAACGTCQKTTWYGCGAHIPQVLDSVPQAQRCDCKPGVERDGKEYPPMGTIGGMVKGLFGWGGGSGSQGGKEEL